MPLEHYEKTSIEMPVSDRIFNDTIIKQKARFVALNHSQNEIESRATVTAVVSMFANDNGAYGQELTGNGFHPYNVNMVADNNCLVDATDGSIVAIREPGESDAQWRAKADLHEKPVMFQGDYFEYLREHQPLIIGDLIRLHITQSDAMGLFTR